MNRRLIIATLAAALLGPIAVPASARPSSSPIHNAGFNWYSLGFYDTEAECIAAGEQFESWPLYWYQYNCSHQSVGDPRWHLQVYGTV